MLRFYLPGWSRAGEVYRTQDTFALAADNGRLQAEVERLQAKLAASGDALSESGLVRAQPLFLGFLRVRCETCRAEHWVAFGCYPQRETRITATIESFR